MPAIARLCHTQGIRPMIRFRLNRLIQAASRRLWETDPDGEPVWRATLLRTARIAWAVVRDLGAGQLTLQAVGLVYTTLLSLVPLLAVSFSVLKAFGVHNQAEPLLQNFLRPLGPRGDEITSQIIGFVENMRVGVLGSVGMALLIYTVIALIRQIERAFNVTWHISRRPSFAHRMTDYLAVILLGPVLIFSAISIGASVMSTEVVTRLLAIEALAALVNAASTILPFLLVVAAFTFAYVFVPNTRVRLPSAMVGALVAAALWQTIGWAFASVVAASATYAAVYSGFAIVLIFMVWLYLSWLILLVGASIAFYHQHPEYQGMGRRDLEMSGRVRERLALLTMTVIGRRFYRGGDAWTAEGLAERLATPLDSVEKILEVLERQGLLCRSGESEIVFLPAHSPETLAVKDVLDAVRTVEENPFMNVARLPSDQAVENVARRLEGAVETALAGLTVKDLALADEAGEGTGPQAVVPPGSASRVAGGPRGEA